MINVKNISYSIKTHCILQNITFQIPVGKIIALAGENGCGKTTLLRLLVGVKSPSSGQITIDSTLLTHQNAQQIAYLPDTDNFYSNLTGVQLFQYYKGQFKDFSLSKANEVAAFLEVELQQKIRTLSKGQLGRLKMAVTLGREATYYILDEPFAGLDPLAKESLIKGILKFTNTEKQTILLSTHELYEVEPILDALLLIKDSQIIAYDMLETIREEWQTDAFSWMKKQYRKD